MKTVIIGGVAAGTKVAAKLRRLMPNTEIYLFTDDTHISYSSCGLPYYIQNNFEDYRMLLVKSPEEFEQQNVHIFLRSKCIKISPKINTITINDLDKNTFFEVNYDKLVIATGASPTIPNIKNVNADNVFTVRSIEDGINIKNYAQNSQNIAILGSGYIGLEMLEAFVILGKNVVVIENKKEIANAFDTDMSQLIYDELMKMSSGRFQILKNTSTTEFILSDNNKVKSIKTNSGSEIPVDMVVLCTGIRPNIDIAKNAGIKIGSTGAIRVNQQMKTNIPNIYACGDCAEKTFLLNGAKLWVPLGSTANKEARIVALNIAGYDDEFEGILGSTVVKCLDLTMAKTGLTEKLAKKYGFKPVSVTVQKTDKVGYMPNTKNITFKLTADKSTGLILGGQAIGSVGSDKRINTLTSAILSRLTVEEFMQNDLTYAPQFSPTIDILFNATEILNDKLSLYRNDR